jgi:hypothetical protein
MSKEELESAFRNANLAWDDTNITFYDLPQTTTTSSYVKGTDSSGNPFEYEMTTLNQSTTTLPWVGDNPPDF